MSIDTSDSDTMGMAEGTRQLEQGDDGAGPAEETQTRPSSASGQHTLELPCLPQRHLFKQDISVFIPSVAILAEPPGCQALWLVQGIQWRAWETGCLPRAFYTQ